MSDINKMIHEPVRLAITRALAGGATLTFTQLQEMTDTSCGNLSVHARKLEQAGYLTCTKGFIGRVPSTEYAITPKGRVALDGYLTAMSAIISDTKKHFAVDAMTPSR